MRRSVRISTINDRKSTTQLLFEGQTGQREVRKLGLPDEWKELAKHSYRLIEVISNESHGEIAKA